MTWLREHRTLSIGKLAARLGVSTMTVHRDLNYLAKQGLVQKNYGRVMLIERKPELAQPSALCGMCRAEIPHRSAFIIQLQKDEYLHACCPHCGFMLLSQHKGGISALTRDFIYGRIINVIQAVYVSESRVHLCCIPSVLCFANRDDAEAFQHGFGGTVMTFEEVKNFLSGRHSYHF